MINNKVREFRLKTGQKQIDVARFAGVSTRAIQRIENGADPAASIAVRIARALNTTVEELFFIQSYAHKYTDDFISIE